MIFKDTELLSNLYEGITNNQLNEAKHLCDCNGEYKSCKTKMELKKAGKKAIEEAKKANKPDYLDVDEDGDEKEPLKKALKDKSKKPMAENISFKKLFNAIMVEGKHKPDLSTKAPISGPLMHDQKVLMLRRLSNGEISSINDEEQYIVSWKDPQKHNNQQEQPLKGESVHSFLSDITSIRRAFQEE